MLYYSSLRSVVKGCCKLRCILNGSEPSFAFIIEGRDGACFGVAIVRRCRWIDLADVLQAAALVQDLGEEHRDLSLRPEARSMERLLESSVHLFRGAREASGYDCFVEKIGARKQCCVVCLRNRATLLEQQVQLSVMIIS